MCSVQQDERMKSKNLKSDCKSNNMAAQWFSDMKRAGGRRKCQRNYRLKMNKKSVWQFVSPPTCSQSREGHGAEPVLLADLQHRVNHVLDLCRIALADNVDDVSARQLAARRQDHRTRLVTQRVHCRQEATTQIQTQVHFHSLPPLTLCGCTK